MGDRFVLLDRDGTLVEDEGYTHRIEDYRLLPGVREGLHQLAGAGYRLAIVTNQSGIARGLFDEAAFHAFQRRLGDDLAAAGVRIERSFFCPHLPEAGCACRKPAPGMLLAAARELGARLDVSWLIGDAASDVEAAARAGCRGAILVHSGRPAPAKAPPGAFLAADFAAAVDQILAFDALDGRAQQAP